MEKLFKNLIVLANFLVFKNFCVGLFKLSAKFLSAKRRVQTGNFKIR